MNDAALAKWLREALYDLWWWPCYADRDELYPKRSTVRGLLKGYDPRTAEAHP